MQDAKPLIVITGASRGIGAALAQIYAETGRDVLAIARQPASDGDERIRRFAADLTRPEEVARSIAHIRSLGRPVDMLINNAGVQYAMDFAGNSGKEPANADLIAAEIALNLTAPLLLIQGVAPLMARPGGTIVNVTSLVSRHPKPSAPVYSATKAGLHSFTESLRGQFAGSGMNIIEAVPPLVDTGMTLGRGRNKLSARQMAQEIRDGVERGDRVVAPGLSRKVLFLNRIVPSLVARILARN
tara:strand:+ start:356 stop:1084 length:729 start_codon:yes stop_codon:yes gene_type:complete